MANKEKEAAKDTSRAAIQADSASLEKEEKQAVIDAGANQVYIASSLQNGMTFTDLETAESGRVTIPGVNNHLQGALEANLLADGGASVLVKLPADQWAEIKTKYGSMPIFTHNPPFLRELTSKNDYDSATLQSELKEVRTGAEPLTNEDLAKFKTARAPAK